MSLSFAPSLRSPGFAVGLVLSNQYAVELRRWLLCPWVPRPMAPLRQDRITYIWSLHVDAITYTTARANLASTMDRVCQDHEPLIITRRGQQSVVMISLEAYNALQETAHLLRSPTNAKRLLSALEALGKDKEKERQPAK
jgi:antitoxin YefM